LGSYPDVEGIKENSKNRKQFKKKSEIKGYEKRDGAHLLHTLSSFSTHVIIVREKQLFVLVLLVKEILVLDIPRYVLPSNPFAKINEWITKLRTEKEKR